METTSLLIEGGGMRGFFSAGVLQCLLDNNINIPYVIGVSSGSLNAVGYVNHNLQSLFSNAQFSGKRFIQLKNLRHPEKGILDIDRFFQPAKAEFLELKRSDTVLKVATTRAKDAKLIYWEKSDFRSPEDMVLKLRASAAIPVLMPKTIIDKTVYVDGGIMDSIPIKQAIADGKTKHIIIVTRLKGYRKGPQGLEFFLLKWLEPYPQLKEAMLTRHIRYNQTMDKLEKMEAAGEVIIIRPVMNRLRRVDYNMRKFRNTYDDGYLITRQEISRIRVFLNL